MKTVAVIGFDGVEALDLLGPLETFARARLKDEQKPYLAVVAGIRDGPITTESGVSIVPHTILSDGLSADTIILPGGAGLRERDTLRVISTWLRKNGKFFRRIASVCTGIYGVAEAGLLDGRRATTHWNFVKDVSTRFPCIELDVDAIYIQDGKFYTSAGILAGVDLALALVQEDFGASVALKVAREMIAYMKRPGGQAQFSEPLRFQAQVTNRFTELTTWINAHLADDLDISTLAAQVALSPRQFSRRFLEAYKVSPAVFVRDMRLETARIFLIDKRTKLDRIAGAVGFRSEDSFRRAFERKFGVSPSLYRESFRTTAR